MTPADTKERDERTREDPVAAVRERLAQAGEVALRVFVGTRLGLVVFLGALAFFGLYWRVGFFINDNYTLANGLVSLADGSLEVQQAVYGGTLETPGMGIRDGRYYARNYGQLVFALPFLWALEGLGMVADPGLVLPMCWALVVLALGQETGRVVERPALGRIAGTVCGLAGFAVNAAVARPFPDRILVVAALQLSSMVATALAVTLLYRLVTRVQGRRSGITAAAVTALATPVGFWATIPKRHVFVVALVIGTCYALARSRTQPSPEDLISPLGFRATAYGLVGLLTWIHGGEALAVFLALVAVDVSTAENDRRSVAVVVGIFLVSMVPFFVTNAIVTGDPLRPPRMIDSFGNLPDTTAGGGSSGSFFDPLFDILPPAFAAPLGVTLGRFSMLFGQFYEGVVVLTTDPSRLYPIFVRGGDIAGVTERNHYLTIYLTVTEAAPVVAGLGALATISVLTATKTLRELSTRSLTASIRTTGERVGARFDRLGSSPVGIADMFCFASSVLILLEYLPVLPLHAQVTVRYLLVLYPLMVYGVIRQRSLRRVFEGHWHTGLWTWAVGVLIGGQAFAAVIAVQSLSGGEAVQVHALVGLAVATTFAILAVATVFTDRFDRATAVAGGLAAALGTDFLLLSGLAYFQYGQYALPAAGWVADLLATA